MSSTSLPPPPHPEGRTRYVYQRWIRDPDGAVLTKPPPAGVRPPNGIIWGHSLADFFWIQRIPGVDVMTIWSRSMLKELGENYDETEFSEPDALQVPRLRRPWPVLKLSNDGVRVPKDSYGVIDEGCEKHAEPGHVLKRRDDYNAAADEAQYEKSMDALHKVVKGLLGFDDGKDAFVLNDPYYPLRSPDGIVYAFLFSPDSVNTIFGGRSRRNTHPGIGLQLPFTKIIDGATLMYAVDGHGLQVMCDPAGVLDRIFESIEGATGEQGVVEGNEASSPTACSREDAMSADAQGTKAASDDNSDSGEDSESDDDDDNATAPKTTDRKEGEVDKLPSSESIPRDSPFSVKDLPRLAEDIPEYYFPDTLYVHDPHNVTTVTEQEFKRAARMSFSPQAPLIYKRVLPALPRDNARALELPTSPEREAHLHLAHQNRLGVGHHSLVHDAPLTLPPPLSAYSRTGAVRVAAKSAFPLRSARELLKNEAKIYDRFPAHMSQDWCGYNLVTPIKHPVPVGPVVPKCYGYYVPTRNGMPCDELDEDTPSPILLMEQCGEPVEPSKFTLDQRSECYSMMLRLHYAGFTHGSFYVRNIMMQPGPLTAPPEKRSKDTPSFRMIDFGRTDEWGEYVGDKSDKDRFERKKREWGSMLLDEDNRAQRELEIPHWNY